MATVRRFEDLVMFKKARELTKAVYASLAQCKDYGFRDQIQRASVSVVSNIAEGFESGTKQGFLNYLYIAKASAGEVRAQLYIAYDIGYLNVSIFKNINRNAEECSQLIASFIQKLKAGGKEGVQWKREPHKDVAAELMSEAGFVRLPNGQVVEKQV